MAFVLFAVACLSSCEFVARAPSTPANPGQPTAPTEVVALAGADLVVVEGARVQLNGASSRALTGEATLSWSQREGPAVVLSNPSSSTPVFNAPLGPARLVFELQAQIDDKADVDEVAVEVAAELPPRAFVPAVSGSPPDAVGEGPISFEFHWPAAALAPVVTPRCPVRGEVVVDVVGEELRVSVEPLRLPCSIVVDDGTTLDAGRRIARAAAIVWPPETTTVPPSALVVPAVVAPLGVVAVDPSLIVAAADGTPLDRGDEEFTAPRQPGRLLLTTERRQDNVSGGVVVVAVDVVSPANAAPVIEGGGDLQVRPGARFRVAATASDADDDAVSVEVRQVLGPPAERVTGFADVLTAPSTAGTLLFHVIAFDGLAASSPDPVRVVVDPAAENLAPELVLPATLFATPGRIFTIDASGARDDSGLIAAWEIVQDENDTVQVLAGPVDVPIVSIAAGSAGERYHFRVSAYDEGSLGVTVELEVVVEDAGPFVDAVRGSDISGTGSAATPFASIAAALETAARHRFQSLQLAVGEHLPFAGRLPDGLGLQGGFVFDGVDYQRSDGFEQASLPLSGDLFVAGGDLEDLTVAGNVVVAQDVRILDADIGGVQVDGGRVSVSGSSIAQLDVDAGASVLADSVIGALSSQGSTTELERCVIARAQAAGGGLFVVDADSLLGPTIVAGGVNAVLAATLQTDSDPTEPVLTVTDATATLEGAVIAGVDVAVLLEGGVLRGSGQISSSRSGVVGTGSLELVDARIDVAGALLGGEGDEEAVAVDGTLDLSLVRTIVTSTGIGVRAGTAQIEASIIKSRGLAVDVDAGALRHLTILFGAPAFALGPEVALDNSVVQAAEVGVLPSSFGRVGFVVEGLEGESIVGCSPLNCFFASPGALTSDGHLSEDPLHPFVDVGLVGLGVLSDIDGEPIPQGAAPDLGADERPVAAP